MSGLRAAVAAAVCVFVAMTPRAQESPPSLSFASPDGTRSLERVERLAVELPAGHDGRVVRVVFSVDGRRICVVEEAPFECEWDFGPDGAPRVIRAVAELDDETRLVARMHTPGRSSMRFRASVSRVIVPAIVTDRRGRHVSGLTRDQFELFEDGVQQEVTYFEAAADRSRLDLVVAIDISGSMAPTMPALRRSVKALLESLRDDDAVTLLAFNQRVFVLARQESDRARLSSRIDGLDPLGFTSLYDAIFESLRLLDNDSVRTAVLAFTDGEDRSSVQSLESVRRRLEEAGPPLYVVTLGPNSETEAIAEIVQELADVSGGQVFRADRPRELDEALHAFREDVRNTYSLGFSPVEEDLLAADESRYRRLSVRIRDGRRYRIRAREGYRR